MRFQTCFIVWHGKEPVFSIDFHPSGKIATGGADNTIKIWRFNKDNPEKINVEFCANLRRHTRSVNVVRFSPNGEYLASGSDDGFIFVWKHDPNLQPQAQFGDDDDETVSKEVWTVVSTLRGGSSEIYDLSWSPDSQYIFSGSVDNTACIWDVIQAKQVIEFREHTHYVQGVCWDPQDQFIMTQSSDQTCRVYKRKNKSIKNNSFHCVKVLKKRQINKPQIALKNDQTPSAQTNDASVTAVPATVVTDNINNVSVDAPANKTATDHKMFLDETVKSFFRRLSWSPEGSLLFVPTGTIKKTTANGDEDFNTTYVFSRHQLTKPIMHMPLPDKPSLIVRCNPTLFKLRPDSVFKEDMFRGLQLPYRMVYAVATQDGVLIYDTQHANAIVMSNKIHYASITDLSWSSDGYTLGVSSSDGYCSFMTFDRSDLGDPLSPEELTAAMKPIEDSKAARSDMQLKAKNKVKKNKENIAPNTAAEASKENTAPVVNILQPRHSPTKVIDNFFRPSPTKAIKRKADEMDQSPSDPSGTPQPAAKKPRKIIPTLISAYAPSLQAQNAAAVTENNSTTQHQPQGIQSAPIVIDPVNSGSSATIADPAITTVAEPVVPAPIAVENMSA